MGAQGRPARQPASGEAGLYETLVAGLVVTQTCDVVRKSRDRPFVEVSPLVELAPDDFDLAARRPRYGVVPALADKRLVADLDRTMTVEKSVVADWCRVPGCRTDAETRAFASALARSVRVSRLWTGSNARSNRPPRSTLRAHVLSSRLASRGPCIPSAPRAAYRP